MGAWGLVKPGQEKKPWVGERVNDSEHGCEGRVNEGIQKGIINQEWKQRMTRNCVFDKVPLGIGPGLCR